MQILFTFVYYLIGILQLAMLIRAVLSWVAPDSDGVFAGFIYVLTEPLVALARSILYRFNIGTEGPLDISFFVAVMFLCILEIFVGAIV